MLLLTMREWLGPGSKMTPKQGSNIERKIKLTGFITDLSLGEAIERIYQYSNSFNEFSLLAIEFELVGVQEISNLTLEQIKKAGCEYVEHLKQKPEDFEDSTMHEMHGDGSNHEVCPKCGLCITCGDCTRTKCGTDFSSPGILKIDMQEYNSGNKDQILGRMVIEID